MISSEQIKEILKDYPYIVAAYLFGSQVTDRAGPMSDIDIAVLLKDGGPSWKRVDTRAGLSCLQA